MKQIFSKSNKFGNNKSSLKSVFEFICTRNAFLFISAFFLIWLVTDTGKLSVGEKIRLNKFNQPQEYIYFTRFLNGQEPFDEKRIKEYQYYYEQALHLNIEKTAVKTLLGFCRYALEDFNESARYFNEALGADSKLFWPFYNLGIMSYQVKKYDQAVKILKEAVGRDPFDTVRFLEGSKTIYGPILQSARINENELIQNLKIGYLNSYLILTASFYYLSDYKGMLEASLNAVKAKVGEEAMFYFYAGAASYFLKNYPEAEVYFSQSIQEDHSRKISYYYLGLTYKALDKINLFNSTKPQWSDLNDSQKNIQFPIEKLFLKLY